jgi:hypothetical protein
VAFDVGSGGSGSPGVSARFTYDRVLATLAWDVSVLGAPADDVVAVVLRHADAEGRPYVVARLVGPGSGHASGTLRLSDAMRDRLLGGELWVDLMTSSEPFGTARATVIVPGR